MKHIDFIEYLRNESTLTEYQIGKVRELLESFNKEGNRKDRLFMPKGMEWRPASLEENHQFLNKQKD
ncbi:MAG: hypothetical protein IJ831_11270 [Spirochaetales bacterium]|nr:hypothetical protein [Spirochaetales bacterium]